MGWEHIANIRGAKGEKGDRGEQGLQGLPGDAENYTVFTQSIPMTTWTVNHGLSYQPDMNLYDSNGDLMYADSSHYPGYFVVRFYYPTTGTVIYR